MIAAFFAALMPDERTSARIQRFKDRTRELVGPQLYLDDPPHTTVYLASFPIGFDAIAHLRAAVIPAPSPVRLHGWHSWVGDPLTGRNTLVCSLHPDDKPMLRLLWLWTMGYGDLWVNKDEVHLTDCVREHVEDELYRRVCDVADSELQSDDPDEEQDR